MKVPFLVSALFCSLGLPLNGAPLPVQVVQKQGRFELHRDEKPYLIKGAGGNDRALDSLAKVGGNSIRLWGDERLGDVLDRAEKLGLTVTAGIWLGQVRQGFDWNNASALAKQRERVRATVEKYKGHPALLCWALGNEMEDREGKNTAVWTEINGLAKMVKELDPNHPTMTVLAEIGGDKMKNFTALCPDVDILGVNAYGGAGSLPERLRKAGVKKPFILTEYGPNGIWETQRNAIGAFPEPTSTTKAEGYARVYRSAVLGSDGLCLGSYAFLWGQKQEVTSTWFSMFLADGTRLGAVDAVSELWSGKPPANRVPVIKSLNLSGRAVGKPGESGGAILESSDPEGDPLRVTWILQRDPGEYGTGGDHEKTPPTYPEAITKGDGRSAAFVFPKEEGLYRLFVTVRDDHGGAAIANVPLRVEGEAMAKGRRAALPLAVYGEDGDAGTYFPQGWMGDTKVIKMDLKWAQQPHSGKTCIRCDFAAEKGWGGVMWQSPGGDWGDREGGFDLTGAKKLTFWARGEQGEEIVTFQFGTLTRPKKFFDTGSGKLEKVVLTKEWARYEMNVSSLDLARIKTGFGWTLASAGRPVTFYLDDIRWE